MAKSEKIKASDLRQKTKKELQVMLEERNQELMNLRFQKAVARLEKPSRISALRRERARILTVMREKAQ
jgi:large subunit ribosomal protein L29